MSIRVLATISILAAVMAIPMVSAESTSESGVEVLDVGASKAIINVGNVHEGGTITWDWSTSDEYDGLDFWIEDGTGLKYKEGYDLQSSKGSFDVPYDGTWAVWLSNTNEDHPVKFVYNVKVTQSSPFINTLGILIIIGIVGILMRIKMRKK